jgi:predicted nucleic acid-binding protein
MIVADASAVLDVLFDTSRTVLLGVKLITTDARLAKSARKVAELIQ